MEDPIGYWRTTSTGARTAKCILRRYRKEIGVAPFFCISRVENGHAVPSLETLEKFAYALESPMYRLFYDGDKPNGFQVPKSSKEDEILWGRKRTDSKILRQFQKLTRQLSERNRGVLIHMAQKMWKR